MGDKDLRFTSSHEWVRSEGDEVTVGLSDYAQSELGDIVFIELPEVGRTVAKDESLTTLESVKSVTEILAPLSGEIAGVNEALEDDPGTVNTDPYGGGWIFKMKLSDVGELEDLMTAAEYEKHIKG